MASTFSTSLRLELPGTGDQPGTWGTTTNTNIGTLLEQAIAGVATVTIADADHTLTAANGVSDEARNAVVAVASSVNLTATRNIIVPNAVKVWTFINNTTGGHDLTIKTAAGTGVTLPAGWCCTVICDGVGAGLVGQITPFYYPASNTVGAVIAGTNGSFTGSLSVAGNFSVSGVTTLVAPRTVGTGRPIVASDNTFGPWSWNGGGSYVQLDVAGTTYGITAFVSDISRKQDITPSQDPVMPLFRRLSFIDFQYKPMADQVAADMPRQHAGVTAQQLQELRPEWVNELPDGTLFPNLLTMLTNTMKAVQELDQRLAALESQLAGGWH